jgi:hypothetical protein
MANGRTHAKTSLTLKTSNGIFRPSNSDANLAADSLEKQMVIVPVHYHRDITR